MSCPACDSREGHEWCFTPCWHKPKTARPLPQGKSTPSWFLDCHLQLSCFGSWGSWDPSGGSLCQPWLFPPPGAGHASRHWLKREEGFHPAWQPAGSFPVGEVKFTRNTGSGRTGLCASWGKKGWRAESALNSPLPAHQQLGKWDVCYSEPRRQGRRVWEVLHPQGTRSRLPTTHNTSKDIAATGRTRGETANTRSTAALGQRHPACPTASTDLTNHSPPRERQPGISPASLAADGMKHTGRPGLGSHEGCGH